MKKTNRIRTITAGGTMLAAAFIAFSLNQSGLTGRATGGAVGCGGIEGIPEDAFSEGGRTATGGDEFDGQPADALTVQPILSADGRSFDLVSFVAQAPHVAGAPSNIGLRMEDRSTAILTVEQYRELRKPRPDTLTALLNDERLRIFNQLIDEAGMRPIFDDPKAELTVFAPTDKALEGWSRFEELLSRKGDAYARAFVEHHVISGKTRVEALDDTEIVDTLAPGQRLGVDRDRRILWSQAGTEAKVVVEGLEGERSMVHIVDGVLAPLMTTVQELELKGQYSMFLTMLDVAGELDRLGRDDRGSTVLALPDAVLIDLGFVASDLRAPSLVAQLTSVVRNHIMDGMHGELFASQNVQTDSGLFIAEVEEGVVVMSSGDRVPVEKISEGTNGVIYDARALIDYAP